ncbi:MAG: RNA-directed DNA polymerase [Eubacteriales bacterium]
MKRFGYIYDKICDIDNIKKAIMCSSRGKRNRKEVKKTIENIDTAALRIQNLLITKTYRPSPYREFTVQDGATHKTRTIFCPKYYPDQIIHWALMLRIEKYLMKGAYHYNCGSIPGKGTHFGKRYVRRWLDRDRKNTKYCLKLDIRKFYPSISNEALKAAFRRKFKDRDVLWLIDIIIDSNSNGVPIGNYTSQWFANFFLEPLDHFIKEKLHVKYYMRYMDDMVLFGRNKKELHKARKAIAEFIADMGLELKRNWQVFKVDTRDVDFLGFRFYRNKTTLRRRNALRIRRRIKKIYRKGRATYKDAAAVISYLGWVKHSDSHYYYEKYIKPYIKIKKLKEVIRNENRKQFRANSAV